MRMIVLSLFLSILAAPLQAEDSSAPAQTPAEIKASLEKLMGDTQNLTITPAPIPGLYEVVAEDSYIFYISGDGRYLIRGGDVLDIQNGVKNVTEERRNGLRLIAMKDMPKEDMIVFAPEKDTKYVLTVFTDVDCSYCRKLHQEVGKLNASGVEVRYLAFPRAGPESATYKNMVSVWCAKDRNQAMTDAKNGKTITVAQCENHHIEKGYELGKSLGVSGTPALLMPNGELVPGYAPAEKLLKYLEDNQG